MLIKTREMAKSEQHRESELRAGDGDRENTLLMIIYPLCYYGFILISMLL